MCCTTLTSNSQPLLFFKNYSNLNALKALRLEQFSITLFIFYYDALHGDDRYAVLAEVEFHASAVEVQICDLVEVVQNALVVAEEQISPEAADQISLVEVVQSALAVAGHNA